MISARRTGTAHAKNRGVMFIKPVFRGLLFLTLFLVGLRAVPSAVSLEAKFFAEYDARLSAQVGR